VSVIKKLVIFFIESNLYIALVATFFTLETQILLGLELQFHPYLFIIFFATFFDYNLHRLYTLKYSETALKSDKYSWLNQHQKLFYTLMILASLGFIACLFVADRRVILSLLPFAVSTIMYSIPLIPYHGRFIRLRDVPYLKAFIISLNWTFITFLLPYVKSETSIPIIDFTILNVLRFLWIFALCLPFDIRDIESDLSYGLKTIPNQLGAIRSLVLASICNIASGVIAMLYFGWMHQYHFVFAFGLISIFTHVVLNNSKLKSYKYYHWGIVDGCLLLHFLIVYLAK